MLNWFVRGPDSPPVREDALRSIGRAVIWVCIGLVLVRGITTILSDRQAQRGPAVAQSDAKAFPDQEARAFAVAFASRYLTVAPGQEGRQARALDRFLAQGLRDQSAVVSAPDSPAVSVVQATVAREKALGASSALVTVAASMSDGGLLYLTVPVARDAHGGLVVFDLPSFSAAPRAGALEAPVSSPLAGSDAGAIGDLTGRFLRAYVDGESEEALAYFLAPETRLVPMQSGLRLVAVDDVSGERRSGSRLMVSASVRVREAASRAIYSLRYHVTLVRRDRWYVSGLAGGPGA